MELIKNYANSTANELADQLLQTVQQQYPNAIADKSVALKNNGLKLDGLTIRLGKDTKVAPTLYLNGAVKKIESGISDMQSEVLALKENLYEAYRQEHQTIDTSKLLDKEMLYVTVLNERWNEEKIKQGPYSKIDGTDLVLIPKIRVSDEASIAVTDAICSAMNMTKTEVMQKAIENSKKKEQWTVKGMGETLLEFDEISEEMKEDIQLQMQHTEPMVVITNIAKNNAAGIFISDEVKEKVAERLGLEQAESFYILPSSTYECIAVPASTMGEEEANFMVQSVNEGQVALDERLSDVVFVCNTEDMSLRIAGQEPMVKLEKMHQRMAMGV